MNSELPNYLKIASLIATFSFLVYSLYWIVYSVFWVYNITINITSSMQVPNIINPMQQIIIIIQEHAASAGYFLAFIGAIFAVESVILLINNQEKYANRLSKTLFFEALFFLLLIPSSIHHLLGVALSWTFIDIYVGLSFLIQALFIPPPFLMLSYRLRDPHNRASILKWIAIATPLAVWGFWVKYMFLWLDTLSPLNTNPASLESIVVTVNSFLTLLISAIIISAACLVLYRKRKIETRLFGFSLIVLGSYFIIYNLVSIWVPVYSSFLYLTDFWIIAFPFLGIAALRLNPFDATQQPPIQHFKQHLRKGTC